MAYLVLSRQGAPVLRFPIEQERVLLGRDLECDLALDDPDISRHHCEITWDGRHYYLTDLSRNGTFINGERVSGSVRLDNQASVDIGSCALQFHEQSAPTADVTTSRALHPTLILKYEPATKALTVEQIHCTITKPNGQQLERTFDHLPIDIGAATQNDLIIADDPYISRQHCRLEGTAEGIRLRDLGSRNGTWWQKQQITTHILPERGQFQVGRTTITYHVQVIRQTLQAAPQQRYGEMLGASPAMHELFALTARVAPSDATVLITGESGTGKELLARALHAGSGRAHRPFVALNCGAIPATIIESELFGHERGAFTGATNQHKGVFEQAHGGTLFLDEIGEMPLELQTRLLRILETRTVRRLGGTTDVTLDLRIITATHRNVRAMVDAGTFREDLYYRLYLVPMHIPPLRERPEDILLLAQHFLATLAPPGTHAQCSPEARQWLLTYTWPGNVRELRHTIERAIITAQGPYLTIADLQPQHPDMPHRAPAAPAAYADALSANQLKQHERILSENALRDSAGNITKAAQALGVARTTLNNRIRSLNLDVSALRSHG